MVVNRMPTNVRWEENVAQTRTLPTQPRIESGGEKRSRARKTARMDDGYLMPSSDEPIRIFVNDPEATNGLSGVARQHKGDPHG